MRGAVTDQGPRRHRIPTSQTIEKEENFPWNLIMNIKNVKKIHIQCNMRKNHQNEEKQKANNQAN